MFAFIIVAFCKSRHFWRRSCAPSNNRRPTSAKGLSTTTVKERFLLCPLMEVAGRYLQISGQQSVELVKVTSCLNFSARYP